VDVQQQTLNAKLRGHYEYYGRPTNYRSLWQFYRGVRRLWHKWLNRRTRGKSLPDWAREFDCASWAQFFLKYVLAHPAVTCAIPATSKPHHAEDNMRAGTGRLPTETERARMRRLMLSL